jgi:hypothetical protein
MEQNVQNVKVIMVAEIRYGNQKSQERLDIFKN